jgi:predicted dehydrogenase
MEPLRVGVIGCGAGIFHLEGYAEEPRAKVVALAGLDTPRCEQLAAKFGVAEIYRDYQDLLDKADVDVVSIAVPNHLHLPVTLAALKAGKHVLVEKPLARHAAEAEEMVAAAEKAGLILAVSFTRRYRADMLVLRKHIEAGGLGDIYYAKAYWMRRSGIPGMGSWFTSKELAGGGPLIDLGVHVLDMALWLMDNPKVKTASAATYSKIGPQGKGAWLGDRFKVSTEHPYEVEDLATAFLRMENGATLQLETSWAAYTGVTDEFGVQLMGDKGGATIHIKDYATIGTLTLYSDLDGIPVDSMPRLVTKHGHAQIIHGFVDGVLNGTPVSPDGKEGLDRVRLIDAIYRSAELGREVPVEH